MFSSRISWTCLVLREDVRRVRPAGARVALIGPGACSACRVKKRWKLPGNEVDLLKHGVFNHQLIKHGDVLRNLEHWTRSSLQGVKIHQQMGQQIDRVKPPLLVVRGVLAMAIHQIPIGGSEWEEVVDSDALPDYHCYIPCKPQILMLFYDNRHLFNKDLVDFACFFSFYVVRFGLFKSFNFWWWGGWPRASGF